MMDINVVCRYYDPIKAPFVHATMVPAVRAASRFGVSAHLERHWLHGPQVSVVLQGEADPVRAAVGEVRELLAAGLAARPSRSELTATTLLEISESCGRAELVPGPYEPIHPDNSIQVAPPDHGRLAELLGGMPAVRARADLLVAATAAIDRTTASLPGTPGARIQLATSAMAAHAAQYGLGVAGGYMSFLSHLEDFLFRTDGSGALRARFEQAWQRQPAAVLRCAQVAIAAASGESEAADPVVQAWADWSGYAVAQATEAFRRGEIPLVPGDGYRRRAERFDDPELVSRWSGQATQDRSEFHRVVVPRFEVQSIADIFGPYRFATNVLYQVLLLCDVTPLERYLAAFLVARAVGQLTGNDWRQLASSPEVVAG